VCSRYAAYLCWRSYGWIADSNWAGDRKFGMVSLRETAIVHGSKPKGSNFDYLRKKEQQNTVIEDTKLIYFLRRLIKRYKKLKRKERSPS
jgi:hypothetical protein